jgi:hypothetical protein
MAVAAGIQQALKKASADADSGRRAARRAGLAGGDKGAGSGGGGGQQAGQQRVADGAEGRQTSAQDLTAAKGGPGVLKQDVSSAWIC